MPECRENVPAEEHAQGSMLYVAVVALVAALGGLLFGYDTAVINGAIGFLTTYFDLNPVLKGWAVSSALVGCIVGACFAGVLSDWMGRKKVLLISAVLFTLSAIGSAIPESLTAFAVARMLGGFAVGAASMLSPLYIAEIAPAHIRGRLVSLNQLTIVFGMLVVFFVNALVAWKGDRIDTALVAPETATVEVALAAAQDASGTVPSERVPERDGTVPDTSNSWNVQYGWRWMFGSETLPCILFLVCLLFVPESPRWLVKQGRAGEALRVLTRVNGATRAAAEIEDITETLKHEGESFADLFRPDMRKALAVGCILAVLQQITGINVILYYGAEVFRSAGIASTTAIYQTVIVGTVNVLFTLVAIWIVDRVGRKPLLMLASAGMGTSLFLVGCLYRPGASEGPWVLICVLAYVASFALAMGPVVWVVLSEIFPTRIRGTAMSVAVVLLWTANFLVTQFYPSLMDTLRGNAYHIFGVMCVIALLFVAFFIPETKGKSLEQIETEWLHIR